MPIAAAKNALEHDPIENNVCKPNDSPYTMVESVQETHVGGRRVAVLGSDAPRTILCVDIFTESMDDPYRYAVDTVFLTHTLHIGLELWGHCRLVTPRKVERDLVLLGTLIVSV